MSLELLLGYFYDADGNLVQWYQGYGDLENLEEFLEHRGNATGFVSSKSVDTNAHKYDFETQTIIEI
tara:strand:+ start:15359 stop:15559 length:201 start_codon:yes stop_codon:yes gene_type:complete